MNKEKLSIDIKKRTCKGIVTSITFLDGNQHVTYIPSLEISGYGDDPGEAEELLKISIDDFFKHLFELPEDNIFSEMNKLGWVKHKYFNKQISNLSDTTFEDIRKEFNLPDDTHIERIPIAV